MNRGVQRNIHGEWGGGADKIIMSNLIIYLHCLFSTPPQLRGVQRILQRERGGGGVKQGFAKGLSIMLPPPPPKQCPAKNVP